MATIRLPPDFKEFLILLETSIFGVTFAECYAARLIAELDGVRANLISLEHLRINKAASGRYKDLNDLTNLG
mgnify:CR=1 FL=1